MNLSVSALTLFISLLTSNLFGQWGDNYIELSHDITKETKDISGFDKIDVSEDFVVYIRFSDQDEKVVIESNENLHELIDVRKEGRTLTIDTKSYSTRNKYGKKGGAKERLVAYISAKELTEIRGDEDVVIHLEEKLSADELTIKLDEDSTLKGHLEVQSLMVELNEDSVLDIEGSASKMNVKANEDSMIGSYDFTVGDLSMKLSEDSESRLTVNGDIDLRAKGDSYFYYRGNGNFTRKHLTGDSEVKSR